MTLRKNEIKKQDKKKVKKKRPRIKCSKAHLNVPGPNPNNEIP